MRIDTITGRPEENDSTTRIDRGLGIELTNLKVGGHAYCSLVVKAFPDDSAMGGAFPRVVETFLNTLTEINLNASHSKPYPAWLETMNIA